MLIQKRFLPKPLGPERFRSLGNKPDVHSEEELQAKWSKPDSLFAVGERALDRGDAEFAYRCMSRVVEIQPNNPGAWLWLGVICQEPEKAISCYEQAITMLQNEIKEIQSNDRPSRNETNQPWLTIESKTALQRDRIHRATEGIAFEQKRLLSSSDTHQVVARVRLAAPTRIDTWSNCEDESGKVIRRLWGWVQLLGIAGVQHYRIRFPDGCEGYANDNETLIDIVPIHEPVDKRNIVEDPANVIRSLMQEALAQLEKSPQAAVSLILKRVVELENRLELPPSWWYERAGDLAYLGGDLETANAAWAKANAKTKMRYLFAKKPEDIDSNLIKAYAEDIVATFVVPLSTPEFYLAVPDRDDPYDKGRNKVQRTYPEEIATAFKGEIQKWQSENGMTFADFLAMQVTVEPHTFFFYFPESAYNSQQLGYIPGIDFDILDAVDEWWINAANRVRRAHGIPLRGSLYEVVKQVLNGVEVVRQHEVWKYLPWLRPQQVDIFVPKLNLGIEYQGEQHFRPVEIYGGNAGFQATVARDQRKRELFEQHGVRLIYVTPEDALSTDAVRRLLQPFLQGHTSID